MYFGFIWLIIDWSNQYGLMVIQVVHVHTYWQNKGEEEQNYTEARQLTHISWQVRGHFRSALHYTPYDSCGINIKLQSNLYLFTEVHHEHKANDKAFKLAVLFILRMLYRFTLPLASSVVSEFMSMAELAVS